jgi:hypothetical protein
MPMVPEEHHGSLVIFGMVAWSGQRELGEAAIAPFRALATPLADMVQPISYPEMFPPEDAEYHPTAVSTNLFMRLVDESVAGAMLEALAASDAPMRAVQLRVQGGAIARVPADATAYAHRSSPIMVNIAAFYDGADDRASKQAWVDELSAALDQGEAGAYVNFVGDEGADRVRAAYPAATFARLAAVKSTYDPTNLFRLNQNVPPAAER